MNQQEEIMHIPEARTALAASASNAISSARRCGATTAFDPSTRLRSLINAHDYGQHEAMHAASVFALMVENHLAGHPQVEENPEWKALAKRAVEALWDLYQGIAAVHIQDR
jgi:hypothetical protein